MTSDGLVSFLYKKNKDVEYTYQEDFTEIVRLSKALLDYYRRYSTVNLSHPNNLSLFCWLCGYLRVKIPAKHRDDFLMLAARVIDNNRHKENFVLTKRAMGNLRPFKTK